MNRSNGPYRETVLDTAASRALPETRHAEAFDIIASSAWRFLLMRKQLAASIIEIVTRGYCYSRARYKIERRVVSLELRRLGDRQGPSQPLPDVATFDPWAIDPVTIAEDTQCIATCPRCASEGRVECPCGGTKTRACDECDGSGSVPGKRTATKQCPSCRGKGSKRCRSCSDGVAACETCGGGGRVRAWLTVHGETRTEIKAHPAAAAGVHTRLFDPGDFDAGSWPFDAIEDRTDPSRGDDLPRELKADIDSRTERVTEVHVQTFDARWLHVRCATALGEDRFDLGGQRLAFLRPPVWSALAQRRTLIAVAAAVLAVSAFVAWLAFRTRDPFFARYANELVPVAGAAVGGVGGVVLATQLLLRAAARSRRMMRAGALLAGAGFLVCVGAFVFDVPSLSSVRTAITRGDLVRAEVEADALSKGGTTDALESARDDLRVARIRNSTDIKTRASIAREPWHSPQAAAAARAEVATAGRTAAFEAYRADNRGIFGALRNDIGGFDRMLDTDLDALASLLAAKECIASRQIECAESAIAKASSATGAVDQTHAVTEQLRALERSELSQAAEHVNAQGMGARARLRELDAAKALAGKLKAETGAASPSVEELEKLRPALSSALAAEQRIEEQRAAQHRAELARKEAAAAAEAQRDANRPLLCCDGEASPSCVCGGNHRGCCSHHGGVCGCVGK